MAKDKKKNKNNQKKTETSSSRQSPNWIDKLRECIGPEQNSLTTANEQQNVQNITVYQTQGNIGLLYKRKLFSIKARNRLVESCESDKDVIRLIVGAKWGSEETDETPINFEYECGKANVSFKLKLLYPGLYTGLGYTQAVSDDRNQRKEDFKTGMLFDYTTGLPYIPGSEVKGILRTSFINHTNCTLGELRKILPKEQLDNLLNEDNLLALECKIFGNRTKSDSSDNSTDKQGSVIFFDAFPIEGSMGTDNITPHHKSDEKSKIPPELLEPQPIKTLKVAEGSIFEFRFLIPDELTFDNCKIESAEIGKLFEQMILDWGIGAKTKVGYGTFDKVKLRDD